MNDPESPHPPGSGPALEIDRELDQIAFRSFFNSRMAQRLLGNTDRGTLLARACQLAVPLLAEWCWIDLFEPNSRSIRRAHLSHGFPQDADLAQSLRGKTPPPLIDDARWQAWIGEERPWEHNGLSSEGPYAGEARFLQAESVLAFPLTLQGQFFGALCLARKRSPGALPDFIQSAALDLAAALSRALDQHRRFEEATHETRSREEFLSTASHEIRTPLAALKIKLGLIRKLARDPEKLKPEDLPILVQLAGTTEYEVDRLVKLTQRLLDFSRIQAGRLTLEHSEFDLSECLAEIAAVLLPQAREASCELDCQFTPGIRILADQLRIEQVATNLLSNAIKYGAGKPVRFSSGQDARQCLAWFEISDSGIGIPESDQEAIFDPFRRARASLAYEGTGLGLYIVRKIIESHGGTLELKSRTGSGTRVRVQIPLRPVQKPVP